MDHCLGRESLGEHPHRGEERVKQTYLGQPPPADVKQVDWDRPLAPSAGGAAATHYSFMGYILQPRQLLASTAPAIAARMNEEAVDVAVLVPV